MRKEKNVEFNKLTDLVMEYKKTQNGNLIPEIQKLTERSIYDVCKFYGVQNFPAIELEEIVSNCKTFLLLKVIEKFDASRKCKFITLYVWWLKSYIRCQKNNYMRRESIHTTISLDKEYGDEGHALTLKDTLTTHSTNTLHRVKKEMRALFGI